MKGKLERNRTSNIIVMYSIYLYFLGLSLRNTFKALVIFRDRIRNYVSVWNWIQRVGSCQIYNSKRISAFIIYETVIQISNRDFWLLTCIEPIHRPRLGTYNSEERKMLIAEKFIRSRIKLWKAYCIHRWRYVGMMRHVRY